MRRLDVQLALVVIRFDDDVGEHGCGNGELRAAVLTDIVIKADHDQGKLHVQATHLFGLGVEYFSVPAQEVGDDLLEDFAKALIGQQSDIRKYRVAGTPGTFR
jgi:hypothetical protein